MLEQLDRLNSPDPVAWRQLDYGPSRHEEDIDYEPSVHWNKEQAQRRALRNLEARGLITQEQMSFAYIDNRWVETPSCATPSIPRFMLGVMLTDEGRRVARQRPRRRRRPTSSPIVRQPTRGPRVRR
jgi:hypothetical protein